MQKEEGIFIMVQIKIQNILKMLVFTVVMTVFILMPCIVMDMPAGVYASSKRITGDIKQEDRKETKPPCSCVSKCSKDKTDAGCETCMEDYHKCTYTAPKVRIRILKPDGWFRTGTASVKIIAEDIAGTGNFVIEKAEARIGQSGEYADVTDDMCIKITENCSVYVQVTDINGKVYSKNSSIQCYDNDKPSLAAGINNGLLSIQASDITSGVMEVYVNKKKFTKLSGGTKNIRLQKSDTRYENFTIQAVDYAGNISDVYTIKNPYYKNNAAKQDSSTGEEIQSLPENVLPTENTDAKATVKEYTDTAGSVNSGTQKNSSLSKNGNKPSSESKDTVQKTVKEGKEFYTIKTDNGKIFYLVIDNTKGSDNVYFLTEISENDLLNVTGTDYETLGQDMAIAAVPDGAEDTGITEGTEENNSSNVTEDEDKNNDKGKESIKEEQPQKKKNNTNSTYIFLVAAGIIFLIVLYYFKVVRKKNEDFDDEDEDEEDTEEYEEEIYEKEDTDDNGGSFFDGSGDNEE